MKMKLSEAIEKRERLLAKAQAIETWHNSQTFDRGSKMPKDHKLRRAIEKVINEKYEEHAELDEKINKAIDGLEID